MTVKELAEKMDLTVYAIYKAIKQDRGVGKYFEYRKGKGWFVRAHDVRKFLK